MVRHEHTLLATSCRLHRSKRRIARQTISCAVLLAFMSMRILALLICVGTLAACATAEPSDPAETTVTRSTVADSAPGAATATAPQTDAPHSAGSTQFADAATTPLSDLNLVRAEIPAVLIDAKKAPYAVPLKASCEVFAANVQALDDALGPDLDAPVLASDAGLAERGADVVGNAAVGALRSAAEGVIPFRGWVRKLTGAERYAREVAASIAAGTVRRAFLKGLGQAQGCAAPAAPRLPTPAAQ